MSTSAKRALIDPTDSLSLSLQCELVDLARSSYSYHPLSESAFNLELMQKMDRIYLCKPYFSRLRLTEALRDQGYRVNPKRVGRLMRMMGIQAIYPQPRSIIPFKLDQRYPCLLRELLIERANQVWCSDMSFLLMASGFLYLVAIMDWYPDMSGLGNQLAYL